MCLKGERLDAATTQLRACAPRRRCLQPTPPACLAKSTDASLALEAAATAAAAASAALCPQPAIPVKRI